MIFSLYKMIQSGMLHVGHVGQALQIWPPCQPRNPAICHVQSFLQGSGLDKLVTAVSQPLWTTERINHHIVSIYLYIIII